MPGSSLPNATPTVPANHMVRTRNVAISMFLVGLSFHLAAKYIEAALPALFALAVITSMITALLAPPRRR